jgi:general secretion pathway protein I
VTRTAGTAQAGHRLPDRAGLADSARIVATGRSSMRGYTLIEVIVAFAVLALSILLGILSNGTRQVRWADDAGRAALHAQSLLDQAGVGEAMTPGHREGDFEDGRYRWSLDVTPWRDPTLRDAVPQPIDPGAPQLLQLVLDVRWGDGGPRNRLQLQTLRLVLPDTTQATPL